jgi:hypothetical protein
MSASPLGEVVTAPRSLIERTPKSFWRMESLGISLGGAEAARENGLADLSSWEIGSESNVPRIVARVPPLGPDDLLKLIRNIDLDSSSGEGEMRT